MTARYVGCFAELGLTGTKLGCGEGGCGACTVMVSSLEGPHRKLTHRAVNACLCPLYAVEGCHVVTVEGRKQVTSPFELFKTSRGGRAFGSIKTTVRALPDTQCERLHVYETVIDAGIGSGRAGLHPVQERLSRAHGSQCGFCTPGAPA